MNTKSRSRHLAIAGRSVDSNVSHPKKNVVVTRSTTRTTEPTTIRPRVPFPRKTLTPWSGLIPRNLTNSPYWNGRDSAADNPRGSQDGYADSIEIALDNRSR